MRDDCGCATEGTRGGFEVGAGIIEANKHCFLLFLRKLTLSNRFRRREEIIFGRLIKDE